MKLATQMFLGCLGCLSLLGGTINAEASSLAGRDKNTYPRLSGNLLMDYNYTYASYRRDARGIYDKRKGLLDLEGSLNFEFNKNFSLNSTFMLRPYYRDRKYMDSVRIDDINSRNRLKRDHSKYDIGASELYLQFVAEDIRLKVGKFNPEFGMAWNKLRTHGMYENYLTEQYRLMNKIGGSASILFKGAEATIAGFYEDDTPLSGTLFNDTGRNKTRYGGSGNNGELNSYIFTVKGTDFPGIQGLSYNVGIMRLAEGEGSEEQDSEKGYVFGLEQEIRLATNASLFIFGEWAKFEHFGGKKMRGTNRFNDAEFSTLSASLVYSNWIFNASMTDKDNSAIGDEEIAQISIGYVFNNFKVSISRASVQDQRYDGGKYVKHDYDMSGIGLSYQLFF